MGNKAELTQKYNEVSARYDALNTKISALSDALKTLNGVSTTIDYILKDHGNIKHTYNLAGTAYKNETEAEQKTVKTASDEFTKHKDDIAGQLSTKILVLGVEASLCNAAMATLSGLIATAKE